MKENDKYEELNGQDSLENSTDTVSLENSAEVTTSESPEQVNCSSGNSQPISLKPLKIQQPRDAFFDNIRGLVVLLFLFAHAIDGLRVGLVSGLFPTWFRHSTLNPDTHMGFLQFSFMDLGPIIFYMLIGLIAFDAIERALERGSKGVYARYITRGLAIMGVSAALTWFRNAIQAGSGIQGWNTLTSIGFVYILLTPFLKLCRKSPWHKLIAGVAIIILYTAIHQYILRPLIADIPGADGRQAMWQEGGPGASIAFLGITLIASFMKDMQKKGIHWLAITVAGIVAVAVAMYLIPLPIFDVSFRYYTIAYMMGAFAVLAVAYLVLYTINFFVAKKLKNTEIPLLATLGKNLIVYIVLALVIGQGVLPMVIPPDTFTAMWQLWLAYIGIAIVFLASSIPLWLKKIIIKV